jgi:hypothetical protein
MMIQTVRIKSAVMILVNHTGRSAGSSMRNDELTKLGYEDLIGLSDSCDTRKDDQNG